MTDEKLESTERMELNETEKRRSVEKRGAITLEMLELVSGAELPQSRAELASDAELKGKSDASG